MRLKGRDGTETEASPSPPPASSAGLLGVSRERGLELVNGERQDDYGEPVAHVGDVARAWSGVLGYTITPRDVCLMMVVLKMVRERHKHKQDNIDDGHGWLEILSRVTNAGWSSVVPTADE